ncbi:MAG: hypothetical protein HY647_10760 [Acidobacteria bacterium]|nr:hypothetical protein [Acidobacteriota bacterium]
MIVIICALLAVGAIGFTLFVRERDIPPAPFEDPELKHLETRRQVLYENLKDLQFEYHQGKLSEEDYQSLKAGFLYDLAGVMDSMERLQLRKGKPQRAHSTVETGAQLKSKAPETPRAGQTSICTACGASNLETHRFCGHCGKPLMS